MRPFARQIIKEVAEKHRLKPEHLTGYTRVRPIVRARWEAAHRMRKELKMSSTAIGRRLNRDHTTIIYALRQYEAMQ
jgi:chromosomal replication initiator protein